MRSFLKFLLVFLLLCCLTACMQGPATTLPKPTIIPKPQQMTLQEGSYELKNGASLFVESELNPAGDFLRKHVAKGKWRFIAGNKEDAAIKIFKQDTISTEGYVLKVDEKGITIAAKDVSGAFYGVQTLRQLLPEYFERSGNHPTYGSHLLPYLTIADKPAFPYRGMHLDVGRHFFTKEFIKEYIANLSMLKMNYFHWHLTEDQGWRIEILQYPNLIKHAAYRDETLIGHYNETPQQFDGKRYGGFYSQEDIKEIVAFAAEHNVTIIPEIEMPGHAQAAISAYPELGCTGEQVPVATKWGVFENIYCPKEETFTFLKNVLTEVMQLFPGEYIHIGGDEAPKAHWKACNDCQKLIEDLGLKDEHELQSYFIKEIESFVNSKGKKIIGWDEILEGGLAPNATVMSWRGTKGAVDAAKEGHDVILTPTSHAYFDYYQAEYEDEPLAIGGFLPLKKVYGFNPIPEELTKEESQYVLGAQGNVWTEYMPTEDQVEYMAFPRMLAMSEVVWKGPSEDPEANYPDFLSRVEKFLPRMDSLDINYANHLYDVSGEVIKRNDSVFYRLKAPLPNQKITYFTSTPTEEYIYDNPIPIYQTTSLMASVTRGSQKLGRIHGAKINFHKGITANISLNVDPHPAYGAGGKDALINGISGSDSRYGDKEWLGFWGDDLEITIDLGKERSISNVSTRFYNANGQWIYHPQMASLEIIAIDGTSFKTAVEVKANPDANLIPFNFEIPSEEQIPRKKIVLHIKNYGIIQQGMQGAGNKAWTFIDEIIIE